MTKVSDVENVVKEYFCKNCGYMGVPTGSTCTSCGSLKIKPLSSKWQPNKHIEMYIENSPS